MDERKRVAIEDGYANDLGLALYCFALCEWNVVWCAEKLDSGYIRTVEDAKKRRGKTAGTIAKDFIRLVADVGDDELRIRLEAAANEFDALVEQRNGIFHGKPGTAPDGQQLLFRHGCAWSSEAVRKFSDRATQCSIELNDVLHSRLMSR